MLKKVSLLSIVVVITFLSLGLAKLVFPIGVVTKPDKDGFTPSLDVTGRIQMFWDTSFHDTKNSYKDKNSASLYAHRIRLGVKGEIFKDIHFGLEIRKEPRIHKAHMTFTHFSFANVWVGFFDIPFNRNYNMTSSGKLLFADRAYANTSFGHQRDIGMMLNGNFTEKKVHYWLGVFTGSGDSTLTTKASNGDNSYLVVGRLQFDPMGQWKNGEEWFKKDLKASFGASVYYTSKTEPGSTGQGKIFGPITNQLKGVMGVTADFGLNWNILYLEASATYFTAKYFDTTLNPNKPEPSLGVAVDLAVTVIPKAFLAALRFDMYDAKPLQHDKGTDNKITAASIGATWYVGSKKHAMKIQPEFQLQLNKKDSSVSQIVKEKLFRLGFTLNI